eukprot:3388310-Alexandrium_andersonii.AAC.1
MAWRQTVEAAEQPSTPPCIGLCARCSAHGCNWDSLQDAHLLYKCEQTVCALYCKGSVLGRSPFVK